ncbi:MAG: DUF1175 domain-containing protein [Azoarcus sp.]|jgi:uncharacterized protein YfaT (DUF1175 family)|nr:DUF1175 domain-containing protein [Azoarcus sp.]
MLIAQSRRRFCRILAALSMAGLVSQARALPVGVPGEKSAMPTIRLNAAQSRALRAWIVRIAEEQIRREPTPRWAHRDCAGFVRFAVAEALAGHDARWRQAMGLDGRLPPDLVPEETRLALRHRWKRPDGSEGAYVSAIGLIQENSLPVSRDARQARPADLLFFDQGAEQHLMLWTGRGAIYHNGSPPVPGDNGMRTATLPALLQWNDTRWRPEPGNPNFVGVFSLTFLG